MTSLDFKENFNTLPLCHTSSHFPGPPSNMTSQTPTPPAASSVEYRDEFRHILILIYRIMSIIKTVYCQCNA